MSIKKPCAYCGQPADKRDKEHVIPKCLYLTSRSTSKVQRITIPACNKCNNSWADDEAHFRNVLVMAGEPNSARAEIWKTTVTRSFDKVDGIRRIHDLQKLIRPVVHYGENRPKIYPAEDPRVLRIVRKIIRGLSYYHKIDFPVVELRVWVDVLRYDIPKEFLDGMEYHQREEDIVHYRYQVINQYDIQSAWLITFYDVVTFIGLVSLSPNGFDESQAVSSAGAQDASLSHE